MIGIGKWKCGLDVALIKNEGIIEIYDDNGKYGFRLLDKDKNLPDYVVESVEENGENSLRVAITIPVLYGKQQVLVCSTYDGDTMTGYIKLPVIGHIRITNGRRVTDETEE